jgi:hypothetical protein
LGTDIKETGPEGMNRSSSEEGPMAEFWENVDESSDCIK